MALPLGSPHQLAREMLHEENLWRFFHLHESEPRHAALHRTRKVHGRLCAFSLEQLKRSVGIGRRERYSGEPFTEAAVVVEPWMGDRRDQQLEVGRAEH